MISAAARILYKLNISFHSRAFVALSISAPRSSQGVIWFKAEHPVIKPDFLNKHIQCAASIIASACEYIYIVVAAPKGVVVVNSVAKIHWGDILAETDVAKPAVASAYFLVDEWIKNLRVKQPHTAWENSIREFELIQTDTCTSEPAHLLWRAYISCCWLWLVWVDGCNDFSNFVVYIGGKQASCQNTGIIRKSVFKFAVVSPASLRF